MRIPPEAVTVAAALPFLAIVALLARRWAHRRRAAHLDADRDYALVFPDGPDDAPARGTRAGRALKPRR